MPKKKTTEEFIIDAISKHGEEFDYSKVVYKNSKEKIIVVCKEHGEFLIRPNDHLNGIKCPKCSGNYHMSTEEFIKEGRTLYGNKYDYSKTIYKNNKTKLIIICPIHGEVPMIPSRHLENGTGCPKCSHIKRGIGRRLSKEEFLKRSKKVHKNRYIYDKVDYIDTSTKVKIICRQHGEFMQSPDNHMNGRGCNKCRHIKVGRAVKMSLETFIKKANIKHKNFYSYHKAIQAKSNEKTVITCPIHGDFLQTINNHLGGAGCPKCKGEQHRDRSRFTTEKFIKLAKEIHEDRYDYSKVEYVTNRIKVCIICKEHGEFWQTPQWHLNGANCSKCAGTYVDTELFIENAKKVHENTYDYSEVIYDGNEIPVKIKCKEHGVFEQTPHGHLSGQGCPICASSTGELKIYNTLKQHNIIFRTQYKFKECRHEKTLPFDFYIPTYNLLIEYHGKQHYEYIKYFHKTPQGFSFRQYKDKIKKDYAEKHHNFLEIPYWDFDKIPEILEQKLKELEGERK